MQSSLLQDHRNTSVSFFRFTKVRLAALLLACGLCRFAGNDTASAWANQPPSQSAPSAVETAGKSGLPSADDIESLTKQVQNNADLSDEAKKQILNLYQQVLVELKGAEQASAKAAANQAAIESLPDRLKKVKADLEELPEKSELSIDREADLTTLEQAISQQQSQLDALKSEMQNLETEMSSRAGRLKALLDVANSHSQRSEQLQQQLAQPPAEGQNPAVTSAQRALLRVQLSSLNANLAACQSELALLDAEKSADLLTNKRLLATRRVALAEERLNQLKDLALARRKDEANRQMQKARLQQRMADPLLKPIAERTEELAGMAQERVRSIDQVNQQITQSQKVLDGLRDQDKNTRKKTEIIGLTETIGLMLRRQRSALPDVTEYEQRTLKRQAEMNSLYYESVELEDEWKKLLDIEATAEEIVDASTEPMTLEYREELLADAERLLKQKREALEAAKRDYDDYLDELTTLNSKDEQIIKETRELASYIDKYVLWIRSNRVFSWRDIHGMGGEVGELVSLTLAPRTAANAQQDKKKSAATRFDVGLLETAWQDVTNQPALYAACLLLILLLVFSQRQFRRTIAEIGEKTRRGAFREFLPTLRVLLLTVMLSILGPGILLFLGWRASRATGVTFFENAISNGLMASAAVWFSLRMVRQICRSNGLGEAHFDWPTKTVQMLQKNVSWLIPAIVPLVFFVVFLYSLERETGKSSLARLCFMAALCLTAYFLKRLLHPTKGIPAAWVVYSPQGWVSRLQSLWYPFAVFFPLLLAGMAFVGYYYTAFQLSWRLLLMLQMVAVLFILRALSLRWYLMNRRRIAIEEARQKLAAMQQEGKSDEVSEANLLPAVDEHQVNFSVIGEQVQRLVNTCLLCTALVGTWLIWVDVLPALGYLDRWPLWYTSVATTGNANGSVTSISPAPVANRVEADGKAESDSGANQTVVLPSTASTAQSGTRKITIVHLVLAILVFFLTMVASTNIPGLLEIFLLQRLPFDADIRYAMTRLASYAILVFGVMLAGRILGIGWSQVQWLVGALLVGLGFGLQEIFANFVSGLIILFERPVRVGDIITIDGIDGVVSRIKIRATTITNWDRKEYIVPNKEFVTGRLLNWTLSDRINRIVINVGVAYGSDTDRVYQLLADICRENQYVMKDPAPLITFEGFGDSALNFVVRAYLPDLDNRIGTIHALHSTIHRRFGEEGIEIAFPQRDLHVRSMPAEWGPRLPSTPPGPTDPENTDTSGKP